MFGKLNFGALNARQQEKLGAYAAATTDKPKLVAELNRMLTKRNDGKRVTTIPVYQGKLKAIETKGDSASATIDVGEDVEPIVLHFRKHEGGWSIVGTPQPALPDSE